MLTKIIFGVRFVRPQPHKSNTKSANIKCTRLELNLPWNSIREAVRSPTWLSHNPRLSERNYLDKPYSAV